MRDLVTLVSMPWASVSEPSIQLGTLSALLSNHDIRVTTRALSLDFFEWCSSGDANPRLELEDYNELGMHHGHTGLPEWVFAVPPYMPADDAAEHFAQELSGSVVPARMVDIAIRLRAMTPAFLQRSATELLRARPRVIGFSLSHCQNIPSLVLAQIIKRIDPTVTILLGGSHCEGPMGAALHRAFPWVDVVLRGEAERSLPQLVRILMDGGDISSIPDVCHRNEQGDTVAVEPEATPIDMDEVPLPDYSDYFEHLGEIRESSVYPRVLPKLRLAYESARGCWWGQKSHCRFCGISAATMPFRSKPAARIVDEVEQLARRFKVLNFIVVDYIMDMRRFRDTLPELESSDFDLRFFFEVKANLRREQVRMLHDAGVRRFQPGIESLSTPILQLLGKGVTALQNIRLLKWCAQYGLTPVWNLLTGVPLEPVAEYARMANVMRSLTHLEAPTVTEITIYRFSPYHEAPREAGIEVTGPFRFYESLYPVAAELREDIAYFFEHRYLDGRDPYSYTAEVREIAGLWRNGQSARRSLRYARGPDFLDIVDERPGLPRARYSLDRTEAELYLACEDGATVPELMRAVASRRNGGEIKSFLDELVGEKLVYEEDGRYLSLALPAL